MRDWLHKHSLGLAIAGILVVFMAASITLGWWEYTSDQQAHGLPVETAGFWQWWGYETAMSLKADVFGFLLIVLLTKRLYEIGSAESN